MYDKIKACLRAQRAWEYEDASKRLEHPKTTLDRNTGQLQKYTGKIGNLQVIITRQQLIIINSFWKFSKKNNLIPFTPRDMADTIERISDTLLVKIADAKISELEAGINIFLPRKPSLYLHVFGNSPRYEARMITHDGKVEYAINGEDTASPVTLYYIMQRRVLIFYDKLQEMRAHGEPIPAEYENEFVLRYETRYKNRTTEQFRRPVFLRNLADTDFNNVIINNLKQEYQNIPKANDMKNFHYIPFRKPREFFRLGELTFCELLGGVAGVEAWLRSRQREYNFSRGELKRMLDHVKDLYENANAINGKALAAELDSATHAAFERLHR